MVYRLGCARNAPLLYTYINFNQFLIWTFIPTGRGKIWSQSIGPFNWRPNTRGEGAGGEPRPPRVSPGVFSESAFSTHSSATGCPSPGNGKSVKMSKPQLPRASNQLCLPWGPATSWNSSESRAKPQAALRHSSFRGFLLSPWGSRIQAPPAKTTDLSTPSASTVSSSQTLGPNLTVLPNVNLGQQASPGRLTSFLRDSKLKC